MKHSNDIIKNLRLEIVKKAKDYQRDLRIVYLAASTEVLKEGVKAK
jgi:hypothetical protein